MNNKTLYYQSQIPQTLKYGTICCIVGILSTAYHAYIDVHDFQLFEILPSRILAIVAMLLFIGFSQTLFKKHPDWVIPLYTGMIVTHFINMTFMLQYTLLNPEIDYIYVIGYIYGTNQTIIAFALFAFGASRFFPKIAITWLVLFSIYYFIQASPPKIGYVLHLIIPTFIGVIIIHQRERYFYKNFIINKKLQEKEAMLSLNNQKIIQQNKRLKASNELLESFAHRVSHDLKAPIRSIIGFGKLLKRKYGQQNDTDFNEYLDIMTESSDSMNTLINDLLLYSKIQSEDTTQLEAVDMNNIVIATLNNLHAAIENSDAIVSYGDLPIIYGKKGLLLQVVQNLLSNAIKYQPKGQKPIINIHATTVDGYHKLTFQDNGIGIPKEKQEQIFKLFERLHGTSEYKGNGIGLASTKTIIESLNGKIEVVSEYGKGSGL